MQLYIMMYLSSISQNYVVWRSGSALVSINKVNLHRARLRTSMGDRVRVHFPVPDIYLGM